MTLEMTQRPRHKGQSAHVLCEIHLATYHSKTKKMNYANVQYARTPLSQQKVLNLFLFSFK